MSTPAIAMPATEPVRLPLPSLAARRIGPGPASFTGAAVLDDAGGRARVVRFESLEERRCILCLAIDPLTCEMREQVEFGWWDGEGRLRTHYFDLVVLQHDGRRVAYSIKPAARMTERFLAEIGPIGRQAVEAGFAHDVRLLSAADFDPITRRNAELLHAARHPDPEADAAAREAVRGMNGTSTLEALTRRTGLEGRGFRALLRLVRSRVLGAVGHPPLAPETEVFLQGAAR